MLKVVFSEKKRKYLFRILFFSGVLGVCFSSFIIKDDAFLLSRLPIVPYFIFALIMQLSAILNLCEYMVLSPDKICLYCVFIPIYTLRFDTIPHIQLISDNYLSTGKVKWMILSDFLSDTDELVDMDISTKKEFYVAMKKRRIIQSVKMEYDKKYDYAIREYYNIGANIWKL